MTDITTLRDALQELVDRDCTVVDRTIEIRFASHAQAMRVLREAREAYRAVLDDWSATASALTSAAMSDWQSDDNETADEVLRSRDRWRGIAEGQARELATLRAGAAAAAWRPIETAPKSRHVGDGRIEGVYLLGYCPEPDASNLESCVCVVWWEPSCVCVVWWEPLMNKGRGMWYGEGGHETHPTHWMPLPALPVFPETQR